MNVKPIILDDIFENAKKAVKQAGNIVLSYYQKSLIIHDKSDGSYATQADLASEAYLIESLKDLIPGAGFYTEESGIISGNEYDWVIDPLDGTSNFAHSIPYFCVTVALTYYEKPILGLTYQPITQELFVAQKDGGAFLNGKILAVSKIDNIATAYISGHYRSKNDFLNEQAIELVKQGVSMRNFGAGALDIAYCAAGKLDACFFESTFWWDIAAGSLLISEAGGKVSTLSGRQVNKKDSTFIGSNELIFNKLTQFFKRKNEV